MSRRNTKMIERFAELGFEPAADEMASEVYVVRRAKSSQLPATGSRAWQFLESISNATERKYRVAVATDRRLAVCALSMWTSRPKGAAQVVDAADLGGSIPVPEKKSKWSGQADWTLRFDDGSAATLQAMTLDDWTAAMATGVVVA